MSDTDFIQRVICGATNNKKLVRNILEQDERARNEDTWLIYRVWNAELYKNSAGIYIPFEFIRTLTTAETVTRNRRLIQNKDREFMPTSAEVRRKRGIKEAVYRENVKNW